MKVLHIVGSYPIPPYGGVEATAFEVGKELSALGIRIKVVAPSRTAKHLLEGGCEFIGLKAGRVNDWIQFPTIPSLRSLRDLVRWAEVVHVLNPQELFTLLGIGWALRERRPLVLSMPIVDDMRSHPRTLYRLAGAIDDRLVREAIQRAARVHVKNSSAFDHVSKLTPRGILIPDGFASDLSATAPNPISFRQAISLEDAYPFLLFLGRLHPLKGPDQLIRAVPLLVGEHPRVGAAIVGRDYQGSTAKLRELAQRLGVGDRVRVPGSFPVESKREILDAADVVVVPSLADFVEGFSMVASEAWARGKPVVAYPVGALKIRVKNGVNGFLADGMNVRDLAVAISKALSIAKVERPNDVISWTEVARKYAEMYSRLLGELSAKSSVQVVPAS